jgi:putative transposase
MSKAALMAENALLRQQVIVLRRQVKRPTFTPRDRAVFVLLARLARGGQAALLLTQPDTLLRWHRQGYRLVWRFRSSPAAKRPQIAPATVVLIKRMAAENRLWGAERIRGDLLKRGIRVGKRTVQRPMRSERPPQLRRRGQTWATFVHTHAHDIWACDFLPVIDVGFRTLFAFVIVDLGSRRVVHGGVTRHPTDAWVAQHLREATPFGTAPRFLIRDNDATFGAQFARVAAGSRSEVVRTPIRTPRAHALCERFLGSVRRACLDHLLILHEGQLRRALRAYCTYVNEARPHQGIGQAIPDAAEKQRAVHPPASVVSIPVLGGLHHDYRRAA